MLDLAELVREGGRAVVLIGPYEHHSNILPWRETGAEVIEIDEAREGGVDMDDLSRALDAAAGADRVVGSFSAASNVTGILTDVDAVTRLLRARGAVSVWDYGCAGPYCEMDMKAGTDAEKDAIVFSRAQVSGWSGRQRDHRDPRSHRAAGNANSARWAEQSALCRPGAMCIPAASRRVRKAERPT